MVSYETTDREIQARLRDALSSRSVSVAGSSVTGSVGASRPAGAHDEWRPRLAAIARRVRKGEQIADLPAIIMDLIGPQIERFIRRVLRDLNRSYLERDPGEVAGLLVDACIHLAERIHGWDPEGAPPWSWAERSLMRVILHQIGHPPARDPGPPEVRGGSDRGRPSSCDTSGVPLSPDTQLLPPDRGGWRATDAELHVHDADLSRELREWAPVELIEAYCRARPEQREAIRLWLGTVREVAARERDARVHVEYQTMLHDGHPNPSAAVAARHGLTAGNVRQIDLRLRRRIRELAQKDPDVLRVLSSLPFLQLEEVCLPPRSGVHFSFTAA